MQPEIETVPLAQLASGDRLSLQLYKFIGQPGKKAYIQSNLHGSEIMGNAVIYQLLDWFATLEPEQLAGEVWLLPMCNPIGVNQRSHHFSSGRFNPYDGKDWNRIFWDFEKEADDLHEFAKNRLKTDFTTLQLNYQQYIQFSFHQLANRFRSAAGAPFNDRFRYTLQSFCQDANYVIDLHTSSDQGIEFVYYFRRREESAKLFLLDICALLDEYDGDAFDEAFIKPWLALEDHFAELGREIRFDIEAYTLELGSGMQINPASVMRGVRGVQNFLIQQGIVYCDRPVAEQPILFTFTTHSKMKRYYAPRGGMVQNRIALGTTVEPGQLLYQLLSFNKDGALPELIDICAEVGGLVFDVSTNYAVNEGDYVLGLF